MTPSGAGQPGWATSNQGTDRGQGLRWSKPLLVKRKISRRARNFNAPTLKVNAQRGNPSEISAALVWHVPDTAQAVFEVDDFERYVHVQTEAARRAPEGAAATRRGRGRWRRARRL